MAGESTLFELLGLPSVSEDVRAAQARMRFGKLLSQGRHPWPSELDRVRDTPPHEKLSQCTGLLTHADIFGGSECLQEWAKEFEPEGESEEDEAEEDDGFPWWVVGVVAWAVWELLDEPVSVTSGDVEGSLDGFEIDGIPWTVERMHHPGCTGVRRSRGPVRLT
jgi:hypothetical protein